MGQVCHRPSLLWAEMSRNPAVKTKGEGYRPRFSKVRLGIKLCDIVCHFKRSKLLFVVYPGELTVQFLRCV